eukprot:TRINITY_DN7532_c0_g1_i1.p1 TRINITY_DN7532_c0_g1~~TRINITY_DN7532_c0_g1_i1.p1  ORF type:complete len:181 (+),score=70.90 TRINITY_DN7532_c0_g1_i1:210-752(+)
MSTNPNLASLEGSFDTKWNFWLDQGFTSNYTSGLTELPTFEDARNFWSQWQSLPLIENLPVKCKIHLFKHGIRPEWEDKYLENGGILTLRVDKARSQEFWTDLLVAAVGEQFTEILDQSDDFCGLSATARKDDHLIQLWNKNAVNRNQFETLVLGCLRQNLKPTSHFYKAHHEHDSFQRK